MAVVSVKLMPEGGQGEVRADRKGLFAEFNNRRFINQYVVRTDNVEDRADTIRQAADVPKLGDPFEAGNDTDADAVCTDVRVVPTSESPFVWHVFAIYETDREVPLNVEDPILVPADIQWSFVKYERVIVRDYLGHPLVNSSGEWFDPPHTTEDTRPVLTITRNEAGFNPALALLYQDACNSDVFLGVQPLYAKIATINGLKQKDGGKVYWQVTYEIEFRRESFAQFVLDQGFRGPPPEYRIFTDVTGYPLSDPTLLNGKGAPLRDAITHLTGNVGLQDLQIAVEDGSTMFPPGPTKPPHWYFEVKIDEEIMQVHAGFGTAVWNVHRGYAGTTPATHTAGAEVKMEPYFLRFIPFKALPFAALNFPVI